MVAILTKWVVNMWLKSSLILSLTFSRLLLNGVGE